MSDKKQQHIANARRLMRFQHSGVLATQSLSLKGFPFCSVTPFLMTESGDIVIYASDIAQHSRNMKSDPKLSLCVHDGAQEDSQANARVTVIAQAEVDAVDSSLQESYFSLFPQARKYVQAHDFRFYLLRTERVRYIGGFGEIYWFSKEEWSDSSVRIANQVAGIIEHMHEDHKDALAEIANQFLSSPTDINESSVFMHSCFAEGFHLSVDRNVTRSSDESNIGFKTLFCPFKKMLSKDYDVRIAMIDLLKDIRTKTLEVS